MPRKPAKAQDPAKTATTRQKRVARTTMCIHRIPETAHCKTCDA